MWMLSARQWATVATSASEMTYIVSSGALNSTHSLTHCRHWLSDFIERNATNGVCGVGCWQLYREVRIMKMVDHPNIGKPYTRVVS